MAFVGRLDLQSLIQVENFYIPQGFYTRPALLVRQPTSYLWRLIRLGLETRFAPGLGFRPGLVDFVDLTDQVDLGLADFDPAFFLAFQIFENTD